jgi:hypothetical protein
MLLQKGIPFMDYLWNIPYSKEISWDDTICGGDSLYWLLKEYTIFHEISQNDTICGGDSLYWLLKKYTIVLFYMLLWEGVLPVH